MTRWLRVARKDGSPDPYAMALASHTIATSYVNGKPKFQAWRLVKPAVLLGTFDDEEEARRCAEADLRKREDAA